MSKKKLALTTTQSGIKPPVTRAEMIDAMVELKRREYESGSQGHSKKREELIANLHKATVAFILRNRGLLDTSLDVSVDYRGIGVDISMHVANTVPGFPTTEVSALKEHEKECNKSSDFCPKRYRAELIESIRKERLNLILSDKAITDSLSSALLKIGSVPA